MNITECFVRILPYLPQRAFPVPFAPLHLLSCRPSLLFYFSFVAVGVGSHNTNIRITIILATLLQSSFFFYRPVLRPAIYPSYIHSFAHSFLHYYSIQSPFFAPSSTVRNHQHTRGYRLDILVLVHYTHISVRRRLWTLDFTNVSRAINWAAGN